MPSPYTMSRRSFLRTTAALSALRAVPAWAQPHPNRVFAYIGTYTGASGIEGNGQGIVLCEANLETGELSHGTLVAKTPNPSWIAIHPSKKFLYAVNEVSDYAGGNGSVSAFAIDYATGALRALNTVSSEGAIPAYLSLDASGRFVFVANYGGGSIAVLPIRDDGSLGSATDVHRDRDSVGSTHAADAPPGSFAVSGHDAPHAHMIASDPGNRFVLATDLGQDRIYAYAFDPDTGKLSSVPAKPFITLPSGDGPRHFAFHPNGRWLYSIQEESTTVALFDYDPSTGSLTPRQTLSALPPGFAGTNFASEILIAPNGKTLYSANRLHDTISVFAIETDGRLTWKAETSTLGDYPRNCCIAPGGRFLYVGDQRSDSITSFRTHPETGLLTFTGHYASVATPACITFLV